MYIDIANPVPYNLISEKAGSFILSPGNSAHALIGVVIPKHIQTFNAHTFLQSIFSLPLFYLTILFTLVGLLIIAGIFLLYTWKSKKHHIRLLEEEQKKSDRLLRNILPATIAEELKLYGKTHPRIYKMATVMFADFKNFSQFAEQLKPEILIDELDYCYRQFDRIISGYPIEKIKTIGDSYMCAGGIPIPNDSNPADMVKCALEMRNFIEEYKKEKISDKELYLDIRIGIHTGPLVAGVVGGTKFVYDIWGDTVNIASRMESAGEAGKVNISGDTYQHVSSKFACHYRGKIEVKNKGSIDMYFIEEL